MRRFLWLLLLPCFAVAQTKHPLDVTRDFVLTDKEAIGMLPPRVVCEFTATDVSWSPDGRYLLLVRSDPKLTPAIIRQAVLSPGAPPPSETTLMLVDVAKGTSQPVWSAKGGEASLNQVAWQSDGAGAFLCLGLSRKDPQTEEDQYFVRVMSLNSATAKVQPVLEGANGENIQIALSPTLPRGVFRFVRYDREQKMPVARAVEWIGGKFGRTCSLTREFAWSPIKWTADGARPIFSITSMEGDKPRVEDYVLDFANGKPQKVAGLPTYVVQVPSFAAISIEEGKTGVKTDERVDEVDVAWLKSAVPSKHSMALIGVDATASISPREDAVIVFQQGIVTLRPLVRMPREAFEKALEAAERARVISDAKQCALGVIMFASDNDDQYPSSKGDWVSQISPYVKDNNLLNGFTYTFAGGNANDIQSPADTEIGYKQGPGGRAVAYADGHVRWVPDP